MSDIVEELREYAVGSSLPVDRELMGKAVAEIEKLRKILQALINDIEDYEHINSITPKFSKLCCIESIRNAREILKNSVIEKGHKND